METDTNSSNAEADQLAELLLKHLRQEINAQEQERLNEWIAEHPSHKQVFDRINNEKDLLSDLQLLQKVNLEAWWQKISRQALPVVYTPPLYKRWQFYLLIFLLSVCIAAALLYYER